MSLWKYKYFVDVVECKSFTKAGKKNYVSQTAISQQIADLEKKVGGKLLYRDGGTLGLTELGAIVYERAKEMLLINAQMEKEIESCKEKYIIKIGIDNSINKLFWKKMQEMLDTYYTEEDFKFSKIDCSIGTALLGDSSIDMYIGYGLDEKYQRKSMDSMEVSSHNIGVYVGKESTLKMESGITIQDLEGYKRYGTNMYPCSMIEGKSLEFASICEDVISVDNVETMKLKVEFNDGYAFVDEYYFSACDGTIYRVEDMNIPQSIKVFYKKDPTKKKMYDVLSKIKDIMQPSFSGINVMSES